MNESLPAAEPGASPLGWLMGAASTPWGACREGLCVGMLGSFSLCQSCATQWDLSCLCTLGTLLAFIAWWDVCVCVQASGEEAQNCRVKQGCLEQDWQRGAFLAFLLNPVFRIPKFWGWGTGWNLASGDIYTYFKMWAGVITSGDLHSSAKGHV